MRRRFRRPLLLPYVEAEKNRNPSMHSLLSLVDQKGKNTRTFSRWDACTWSVVQAKGESVSFILFCFKPPTAYLQEIHMYDTCFCSQCGD